MTANQKTKQRLWWALFSVMFAGGLMLLLGSLFMHLGESGQNYERAAVVGIVMALAGINIAPWRGNRK